MINVNESREKKTEKKTHREELKKQRENKKNSCMSKHDIKDSFQETHFNPNKGSRITLRQLD